MGLPRDLLRQARHLATKEPRRPLQASLRRAVSTAYYALFHLLVEDATAFLVRGGDRNTLRSVLARAFDHGEMKMAARAFAGGAPPAGFAQAAGPVPPPLRRVAEAFIELQQARHEADYGVARAFTKREALDFVEGAERAFEDWEGVRRGRAAEAFMVCLLVRKRIDRG